MKKLDLSFDLQPLLRHAQVLLRPHTGEQINQALLTHRQQDIDDGVSIHERMYGLGIEHPYKDGVRIHQDTDFTVFAPELHGTPLHEMWQVMEEQLPGNLCRLRIVSLRPRFCYEFHQDETLRYHVALQTEPRCYILLNKGPSVDPEGVHAFHVPADGHVYELNGRDNMHSAMNGSLNVERIHLIAASDA